MTDADAKQLQIIRDLHAEKTAGTSIPRWGSFGREHVGILLAEIDRLKGAAERMRERCFAEALKKANDFSLVEVCHDWHLKQIAEAIRNLPLEETT